MALDDEVDDSAPADDAASNETPDDISTTSSSDSSDAGDSTPEPAETVEAAPSAGPSLLEHLRTKKGLDLSTKYKTDEEAIDGLLNAHKMVGQRNEEAIAYRKLQQDQNYRRFLESQSQPAPKPAQEPWWNPPKWDDSYSQYLTKDEAGNPAIAEGAPFEVRKAIEERSNYMARYRHELLNNPVAVFERAFQPIQQQMEQKFEQMLQERERASYEQQAARQVVEENREWMFQSTESGEPVRDEYGQPAMTPAGIYFKRQVEMLHNAGIRDPRMQAQLALDSVKAAFLVRSEEPEAPAAPGKIATRTSRASVGKSARKPSNLTVKPNESPHDFFNRALRANSGEE